jgi:hypothetical protein
LVARAEGNGREVLATRSDLIHEDIPGSTQSAVVLAPQKEYDKYWKKKEKYPSHKKLILAK